MKGRPDEGVRKVYRGYTALIGDIIRSRRIELSDRYDLQERLHELIWRFNQDYTHALAARFIVTIGDEFQGLLNDPTITPEIVWRVEELMPGINFRVGIGYGTLTTALRHDAIGMDGPVFHHARDAIREAHSKKLLGGVFHGFGEEEDLILNGYARLLWNHRKKWSDNQREVTTMARCGISQSEISEVLGITKQAVHERLRSAGWEAYKAGALGWTTVLRWFSAQGDDI